MKILVGLICLLTTSCATNFGGTPAPTTPSAPRTDQSSRSVDARQVPQQMTRDQGGDAPTMVPQGQYRNVQDSPEVGRFYQAARRQYDQGQVKEALLQIKRYQQTQPEGQFIDEAAFLLAKDAFDNNDLETASKYYEFISSLNPPSRLRSDAFYLNAVSLYNVGRRRDALAQLAKIQVRELSPGQRQRLFPFWGRLASEEGKWLEATLALVKAHRDTADQQSKLQLEALVEDQIESRLSEAELNFILKEYPTEFPAVQVQMRLVALRIAAGRRSEARDLLTAITKGGVTAAPAVLKRAAELSARLESLGDAQVSRIGALLPLSGTNAELGRALLDGLQLALKSEDGTAKIEVVTADAGPNDDTAAAAFERLVFEDRVAAVVGPLSGRQGEVVASKAAELGVPHISLAARRGLIEKGPFVFRLALTPERQARAVVAYAKEKLGHKRFAILFPEDAFGREFAQDYIKAVEDFGGELTGIASYDPRASDFRLQIENLVGTAFPRFRRGEISENKKALTEQLGREPTNRELEQAQLHPPIVDFDVLFIPDTYRVVGQVAPYLAYADVKNVQLAGASTWKNSNLLSRAGQYLEGAFFVDAFAVERQSNATRNFVETFERARGRLPSGMSAQGWDIGQALRQVYARGAPGNREELRSRLERLGSFDGALGMHSWDSSREVLNELQLFEIRKNNFIHKGGITIRPYK